MPPRTPKHRKAKEGINYADDDFVDADYTDRDEEDVVSSDEDDFVLAFGSLSVNDILDGRRITWSKQAKAIIVQHALAGDAPFAAHSLPTPHQLLTLGHALAFPLNRGKKVAKICLEKLVACVQNTLSPKGLPGLIEERRNRDGSWYIAVSKALIKEASRDTFVWHSIANGDVAEKHAARGRTFRDFEYGNDMGKTALVKETMDLLVRGNAITKDSKTSPMKPEPDLSWLKSPSPGPAATSPMPPPAIGKSRKSGYYGNFTASDSDRDSKSESESESEPKSFVAKGKSKTKAKKPHKKMPSANEYMMSGAFQPESMDETPTPKPKKSISANKYKDKSIKAGGVSKYGSEDDIIPTKQSKSSSARKAMSYSLQSDSDDDVVPPKPTSAKKHKSSVPAAAAAAADDNSESESETPVPKQKKSVNKKDKFARLMASSLHSDGEDEITPPKLNKPTSAKKPKSSVLAAAAAAADDNSESENETPIPKHKKSANKKNNLGLLAAAQSENEADIVPKLKDSRLKYSKKSLLTVRDEVEAKSRKQKHVSFDESDEPTNRADVDQLADGNSTGSKAEQKASLTTKTAADDNLPKDVRNYIAILKELDFSPTQIADMVLRKMADKQQAAASKSTSDASSLLDI